ncbi:17923_t:CDS:2, partial [Funneliformis geosporum]
MSKKRKLHQLTGQIKEIAVHSLFNPTKQTLYAFPNLVSKEILKFIPMIKNFYDKYSQATFEAEKLKDVPKQFRHIAKRVWQKLDILEAAPNPKICEALLGKKNYEPLKGDRKAITLSRAIHPGEILKAELLTPRGISQAELARSINVSVRRVNDICQ